MKVFRIDSIGSSWEQLGKSIYVDNVNDRFGSSVDISSDVNTFAIGSSGYGMRGYVRVFFLEGRKNISIGEWKKIGQDIIGEAVDDQFGHSVSLSGDGKTLAIGAPDYNEIKGDNSGHVRVYRRYDSEAGWMPFGEDIDGDDFEYYSGYSVSLSGDGKTVAISTPYYKGDDDGPSTGQVRVSQSAPTTAPLIWRQQGPPIFGNGVKEQLGHSLAMSSNAKL